LAGSIAEPFRLDGHVALVTGASRGIGRAIALELARAGAAVCLVARNQDLLHEVRETIQASGGCASVLRADLADTVAAAATVDACRTTLGPVDVLVNNAGVSTREPLERLSDEEWRRVFQVNLDAAFALCRQSVPEMQRGGWGRIVNIASISGQTGGVRGSVAYASSKGALIAFTKALARDAGPFGITVNAVAPGQIETDMGARLTPDQRHELVAQIPVGRLGTPEEVAAAVRFLVSHEAGYITGATLDVNGGIARR